MYQALFQVIYGLDSSDLWQETHFHLYFLGVERAIEIQIDMSRISEQLRAKLRFEARLSGFRPLSQRQNCETPTV